MISLLKTKVVLLHFFLLPSEFKHMRPEVSDPIVQRFRGSEVQFGHTVRTYIRQPTDMRPDSDGFTV